jgi:outer membrane murein-binding lipoprotein Lpp
MKSLLSAGVSLVAVVAVGACLVGATPAAAQDAATIQAIQSQIQQLQAQLKKLQADAARRDAALRQAQEEAAQAKAQAAEAQKAAMTPPPPSVQVVAAPPPPPPPPEPLLPKGAFRVGGVTVTLGGFAALEGVYRSRNEAASIDTGFNGNIPFPNSPNYHIPEYRETAQQSRFSMMAEGNIDNAQKLTSYLETDFLSAGTSSNSNQSNSYTLRLRQFWGEYDNDNLGFHVEGGQGWTLATMNRVGMLPRSENVPLTIDAQYVVGFDWARQAEVRVVKDFDDHRFWAGLSVEEPQTIFGSSGGNNCLTGATTGTATGGGLLEYGFGHYELYGMVRFLGGRVSYPAGATAGTPGTGRNYDTTGEGIGGGMILPVVPSMLDFQVSGLWGQGVGRYGSAQIADATFNAVGKIEPLTEYSVMGGFVGHPVPAVDVYAYGGAEGAQAKWNTIGTVNAGYGNPNVSLAGCEVELGSCSAVTKNVVEGTLGAWWRAFKGSYGTAQIGAEYEWVERNAFKGVGATKGSTLTPNTNENIFLFSLRYYPFQ